MIKIGPQRVLEEKFAFFMTESFLRIIQIIQLRILICETFYALSYATFRLLPCIKWFKKTY